MTLGRTLAKAALFVADGGNSPADVDPTTGHGPEWGKAGPIGLLTIVLLCIAVYFLVKSMNRNLKKVPESFDPVPVAVGAESGSASGTAAADDPAATSPPVGDEATRAAEPGAE